MLHGRGAGADGILPLAAEIGALDWMNGLNVPPLSLYLLADKDG